MKRTDWLGILMGVAILGVSGFQAYWLRENYDREKKSLALKTDLLFRETMMKLQSDKFNFNLEIDSLENGSIRILIADSTNRKHLKFYPKNEVVTTLNVIRDKIDTSGEYLKEDSLIISTNRTAFFSRKDKSTKNEKRIIDNEGDRIFQLLYGVDSLQDSITRQEVDSAFSIIMDERNISVPFTIVKKEGRTKKDEKTPAVTTGFVKPVTFELVSGNTFPYLLKRIALPVLFSILLTGITIISFVLLYKNLLRQQRLAALKNEFISNITHELKTPIATVVVAIEALKNFKAIDNPERTAEYLDISSNELQRLGLLVDKVLKLSVFENKGITLNYEPVNLKELTEEVTRSLKLQSEKKRAEISISAEGNLVLQADKLHLLSVIFNLVDNALKYSQENPGIQINLKELEDSVEMIVEDTGIGIPEAYKEKVFEKFFRVPHGDTHNVKGHGLGLSYIARVIEEHKGTISVESEENKGTRFIIRLPKKQK